MAHSIKFGINKVLEDGFKDGLSLSVELSFGKQYEGAAKLAGHL
jgi:hypothetical protein